VQSEAWIFGDGTGLKTGPTKTHSFAKAGTYKVLAAVTDNDGITSPAVSTTITIGKTPTISGSAPKSLRVRAKGTFKASAKDPNTGGKVASYVWSWGNNATSRGASVKHAFTKKGSFKVTLTVTDNEGNVGTKAFTVRVTR
jgi:PKD repeat protein